MAEEMEKASATPNYDRLHQIDECGRMYLKGYNFKEISELQGLDPRTVRSYVDEYNAMLEKQAADDPYFLDKIQINTLKSMSALQEVSKETWESVELATREGMISTRIQALRLGLDVEKAKAQIHQLLGGAGQSDADLIARMQRQESVNNILSRVISEVVADCDHCRALARGRLKEAFAMLDDPSSPAEIVASVDYDYSVDSEEV